MTDVTDVIAPPIPGSGLEEDLPVHLPPDSGGHGHVDPHAGGHEDHGPTGMLKWLTSTDHKVIGLSYMITSIVLFYFAGIMALFLRLQLTSPHSSLLTFGQYNELFTMHGSLMLYLFAGPFAFGGLANYVVPLQIGAPDMAFPRLNALSYWLYLTGSITMMLGFLVAGGAASFGWVAYAPLSSATSSPGIGGDVWIMALVLTGFSAIFTGVNLVATIFYLRAPGMTMFRMPIFTWNMLVTGILILIAFPVLTSALIMLFCRPALRHPYLHGDGVYHRHRGDPFHRQWSCDHDRLRLAPAVAEPLLVLRPSRGVHPRPALLRHRHRGAPRLLPQTRVRLQGHGLRHHGHRRPVHRRVGAPHVHHRGRAVALLLVPEPAHRRPDRDQVLQLDRHHVARPAASSPHPCCFPWASCWRS